MREAGGVKNWPRCYPLVYHNIDEEIPEAGRSTVRGVYRSFLMLVVGLVWNFVCVTGARAAPLGGDARPR